MEKLEIVRLLNNVKGEFGILFNDLNVSKGYFIMDDNPCPIGQNKYETAFCVFFYSEQNISNSFRCTITGIGKSLQMHKTECYQVNMPDNKFSSGWTWVNIAQ